MSIFCKTKTCEDCGCEIKKKNAYRVKEIEERYQTHTGIWYELLEPKIRDKYFCKRCKPEYDIVVKIGFGENIKYKRIKYNGWDRNEIYKN